MLILNGKCDDMRTILVKLTKITDNGFVGLFVVVKRIFRPIPLLIALNLI